MSKIICDICGTTYQDTADCCPICGCSRDSSMDFLDEAFELEESPADVKKGKFSSKNRKEIFDYDEVNADATETEILDEDPEDDTEVYESRPKSNTGVIVTLTVLIALLLMFAAFLGFRYILPNLKDEVPASTPSAADTEYLAEPTSNAVHCQNLGNISGPAVLNEPGQYFLLNIVKVPEDSTDEIIYQSENESIATVSADGKITAVAEGETVIFITCGKVQLTCPVTVKYEEETLPPTEAVEETEATEAPTEAPATEPTQSGLKNVTLKLKKTDVMLTVGYGFRLELDCDLDPSEVEWSVEHEHIASVDETGLVKAKKGGTTAVIVKYGDQEAKCMVRCG